MKINMPIRKTLFTLILAAMPSISQDSKIYTTFDSATKLFVNAVGGVDEEFLNMMDYKKWDGNFIRYLQKTDSSEKGLKFFPFPKIDSKESVPLFNPKSIDDLNNTYFSNCEILNKLDKKKVPYMDYYQDHIFGKVIREKYSFLRPDSMPSYFVPVKSLLEKLNKISENSAQNKYIRFARIYSCIVDELAKTDSLRNSLPSSSFLSL